MALPKIGIVAILDVNKYLKDVKKYNKALNSAIKTTNQAKGAIQKGAQSMVKSFHELQKASGFFEDMFQQLNPAQFVEFARDVELAFQNLGKGAEVNVQKFDELMRGGATIESAMQGATTGVTNLSAALVGAGVAVGALVTVYRVLSRYVNDSIEHFAEAARETRLLRLELGATSEEIAVLTRQADVNQISVSSLATTIGFLEKQLVDLRLRQIEGKEATTSFSRGLRALGIDVLDGSGNFKDATVILEELRDRVQELGPGLTTTGLLASVFGRSVKNILPYLLESAETSEESKRQVEELGLVIDETTPAYKAWQKGTVDVEHAKEGLGNTITRAFMPALTDANELIVKLIKNTRDNVIEIIATVKALIAFADAFTKTSNALYASTAAMEVYDRTVEEVSGTITDEIQKEQELKQARDKAAQAAIFAAFAEGELAAKRQEVLQQLTELEEKEAERSQKIEDQYAQRLEDLEIRRGRQQLERSIRLGWQLQDLWQDHQDKLSDITAKHTSNLAKIERTRNQAISEFKRKAQKQREDLEEKHQDRLYKIQTKYLDTIQEAARRNDAVAVVRAMRTKMRELRDAERARGKDENNLKESLAERRKQIQDDYEQRKAEENVRYQEQLEREKERYAKQLEDLRIQKERERYLRQKHHQWEEEDLKRAKQRQLDELNTWYAEEKRKLEQQLDELKTIAVDKVNAAGLAVAQATTKAMERIAGAGLGIIGGRGPTSRSDDEDLGIIGGRSVARHNDDWRRRTLNWRAQGGMDVVNRPTHYVAGEAGAEIAAFMPLRQAMNVNHSFGNLPVNVEGVPSGTNTVQAEQMVYAAMTRVAEGLLASMRTRR